MTKLLKFCIKMFQTFEIPKSSQKLELRKIYGSWDSRKLIGICFAAIGADGGLRASVVNSCPHALRAPLGVMMLGLVDSLVEGVGDILSAAYSRAISASRALICDATVSSSNLSSLPCVNPSGDVPMRRCAIAVR